MDPQTCDPGQQGNRRGPKGFGEDAAAYLGKSDDTGEGIRGVSPQDWRQQALLREWAETRGRLITDPEWESLKLVSQATSEHEVRFHPEQNRAWKRTWPGTFGFVPRFSGAKWELRPATPLEYLERFFWQNELFGDDVRMEGAMLSSGPSLVIGQQAGGISLVISQPWLDALNEKMPHPDENEISDRLRSQGFEPLFGAFYGWLRREDGIVVTDARPDNFIKTAFGVLPIDLHITQAAA